jgi:tetratricopeptide (TPR) repeat protein
LLNAGSIAWICARTGAGYERLGDLLRYLGQGEGAQKYYEQSLALSERLARAEPNRADYQRDLSVSYERLGDLLRDLGQGEGAQKYYGQSLALSERLARAEPNRADYQWDLAASLARVPTYDSAGGPAALRRALDILKDLEARGALLPTQEPWITEIESRLAAGPGGSE